jgi:hypothetical protein
MIKDIGKWSASPKENPFESTKAEYVEIPGGQL